MSLKQRFNIPKVDGEAYKSMMAMEKYVHGGTLGEALLGLVKMRASQINGCAFCLDMHGREARKAGVNQRQIDVLSGWHEAPDLYSERERAALALTEEVTRINKHGVSDGVWQNVTAAFNEGEIAHLMMAICAINVWNRLAITVHQVLPANPS